MVSAASVYLCIWVYRLPCGDDVVNPRSFSPLRSRFLVAALRCLCSCEYFINTCFLTLKIGRDKKRRKKVALPMFASMEDYAHLIDQEDSE